MSPPPSLVRPASSTALPADLTPEESARHVTIWNRLERRKIAGNAAPLRRNVARYLAAHPECEVFDGQDKRVEGLLSIDPATGLPVIAQNEHVPIWHARERRKVTGNAAPLRKNVSAYLKKHRECEVYDGQDKEGYVPGRAVGGSDAFAKLVRANGVAGAVAAVGGVAGMGGGIFSSLPAHAHGAAAPAFAAARAVPPPPEDRPDIQYGDLASSWSNMPSWQGVSASPATTAVPMAIPTPAPRVSRGVLVDRDAMSFGTSLGGDAAMTPGSVGRYLLGGGASPGAMDFSPSNFLAHGSPASRG